MVKLVKTTIDKTGYTTKLNYEVSNDSFVIGDFVHNARIMYAVEDSVIKINAKYAGIKMRLFRDQEDNAEVKYYMILGKEVIGTATLILSPGEFFPLAVSLSI